MPRNPSLSYLSKPVLSLGRMEYAPGASNVIYHGKNEGAPGRGTVVYDPLEFLALVLAHLPEPREIRLRYYGAASSTIRRGGRKGRLAENETQAAGSAPPEDAEESGYVKARRKTWAQLLVRVCGVDALRCERCGGRMRIIAWITDPEVIERILRHVGKRSPRGERRPPEGSGAAAAPREWRVVVDEYAQEFPCDGDPAGARDDWGGIERVEREWDWGA